MKKLMIAMCAGFAAITSVIADNAKIEQARAAANALLDEIDGKAAALPDSAAEKLTQLAAEQNPPPSKSEIKKDKGIQTVIKIQKSKNTCENLGSVVAADDSAKMKVIGILKDNGIKVEATKDYIISVVDVSLPVEKDPAQDANFFITRDIAMRMLALKAKSAICASLGGKFSAEESLATFGSTNMSVKLTSESQYTSQWPIYGVTMLAQAEAWDGKKYTLAGAAVWSKVLQAAARAMLCGENNDVSCGAESVEDWLEKADLSIVCGPRQVLDEKGNRVFLGIASRELTGKPIYDEGVKAKAEAAAREHLMFSIFSDVSLFAAHNVVADFSDDKASEILEGLDNLVAQRIEKRVVSYDTIDQYCRSYRHPMVEGKKVYVAVLRTSAEDIAKARVMAEEMIAIRKATELANMRELGRLQGYLDQIADAKSNTEEFERGRTAGNLSIEKQFKKDAEASSAQRGRRWSTSDSEGNTPVKKKEVPKARTGVFSGEAPIQKNF